MYPRQRTTPSTNQPNPKPQPHHQIDCVANRDLCGEQVVRAFPTLRLFKSGKALSPDYREDRTVEAFTVYTEMGRGWVYICMCVHYGL